MQSNDMLKLWRALTNEQMGVEMPMKCLTNKFRAADWMNQWILKERSNQTMIQTMNQPINEKRNRWINEATKQWTNESVDERSSESIPVWIPPMWPGPAILKAQFLFQTSASIKWWESFGKWPHVATTKPQCAATLPKEPAGQLRSDDNHRWQPSPP